VQLYRGADAQLVSVLPLQAVHRTTTGGFHHLRS
jgi:hypothetical protein